MNDKDIAEVLERYPAPWTIKAFETWEGASRWRVRDGNGFELHYYGDLDLAMMVCEAVNRLAGYQTKQEEE